MIDIIMNMNLSVSCLLISTATTTTMNYTAQPEPKLGRAQLVIHLTKYVARHEDTDLVS